MAKVSVDERNENAKKYVHDALERNRGRLLVDYQGRFPKELEILERLIPVERMGFRGLVLTAIVGKYLDRTFSPLENFYACNPRSIFEKGIRYALKDAEIPCGKSDPLNVAKGQSVLDSNWAKGRRPETAAKAVLEYLEVLERAFAADPKRYRDLVDLFFVRLLLYAESIKALKIDAIPALTKAPLEVGRKIADLVINCPEAGAVPQFVVGQLLSILRVAGGSIAEIGGLGESVFGTNTTSKKPGDLWEIRDDGGYENVYEVTVKTIDRNRLDDCVDNIIQLGLQDHPVTFICELPGNIEKLAGVDRQFAYRGVHFQFLDISGFIENVFVLLSQQQRNEFLSELHIFMSAYDRPIKTKKAWVTLTS